MRASAVKHALRILELLEDHPVLRFRDLRERIEASEPTLAAILKMLAEAGVLQKGSDGYRLGPKLLQLATRMLDRMDVRTVARTHLAGLRQETGETIELCIPDGPSLLVVDKFEGAEPLGLHLRIGGRFANLHAAAHGKVLLAFRTEAQRQEYYDIGEFVSLTPNTVRTPEILEKELARIRRVGTAVDVEEVKLGVARLAAVLLDHQGEVAGTIAIPMFVDQLTARRRTKLRKALAHAGEAVSRDLGFDGPYGTAKSRRGG